MALHDTKKKIMDTATGLIKEKGYTKVSVDEICKKCGMTRGAFYHHYKSKDDMLENYYNLFNEVNADNILKVVEFSTPETQLWALLEMYIDNTISLGPDLLKRLSSFQSSISRRSFPHFPYTLTAHGRKSRYRSSGKGRSRVSSEVVWNPAICCGCMWTALILLP